MNTYDPTIPGDIYSLLVNGKADSGPVREFRDKQLETFMTVLRERRDQNRRDLIATENKISQEERNKAEAAAQGDRSENAEYHAAIENLAKYNSLYATQKKRDEVYTRFIEANNPRFFFIADNMPHRRCWVLVPDSIADADIGALSECSPVGMALNDEKNFPEFTLTRGTLTVKYTIWR